MKKICRNCCEPFTKTNAKNKDFCSDDCEENYEENRNKKGDLI